MERWAKNTIKKKKKKKKRITAFCIAHFLQKRKRQTKKKQKNQQQTKQGEKNQKTKSTHTHTQEKEKEKKKTTILHSVFAKCMWDKPLFFLAKMPALSKAFTQGFIVRNAWNIVRKPQNLNAFSEL